MPRKFASLLAALLLIAGGSLVFAQNAKPEGKADEKKAKKLEFELKDTKGKTHKLSDYKDKYVVLEWIEPGCPYCVKHAKEKTINELVKKYGKKEVVFLGICTSSKTDTKAMEAFREEHKLQYTVLMDTTGEVGRMFKASNTPHLFIVKNGAILYQGAIDNDPRGNMGEKAENYIAKALDELLEGKKVSTALTKPYG